MLTAKSLRVGTSRFTGSLGTAASGAMVTLDLPPKASAQSEPGPVAAPLLRSATWAAPICSGNTQVNDFTHGLPVKSGRRCAPLYQGYCGVALQVRAQYRPAASSSISWATATCQTVKAGNMAVHRWTGYGQARLFS